MTDTEERIGKIRSAYELLLHRENINNTLQKRTNALQFLEREIGTKFNNTEDFLTKMDKYIVQISGATELKRIREAEGLSQDQLGKKLGYSQSFINRMERGTKSLTAKIIKFMEQST